MCPQMLSLECRATENKAGGLLPEADISEHTSLTPVLVGGSVHGKLCPAAALTVPD